ncbi:putative sterigmatocystin biosynthesis monooxygenase stcW [Cyphellophora attinorum]|uniref:Putative sterigmatocystin biosynthesis monooxygenase stcW n=1 Tax=Cyphellophora attinorum TaxID=1664694 RepID=A0A0N1HU76_9EURO|nr:putative sterigmatocystin biosynthesis monooxygenase stcW [Phialophora attinorum]KPI42856.1 putative sterigmatocystin biosynthesis monooxygenase stcW [Phialophora attinorum]
MPSSESAPLPAAKGTNGNHNGDYNPKDQPVENFRPMKVVAIGAGFSGIYLSIRLPELLRNVELVVYEKNEGLGGTWWENRYPGCACDIPAHSYVYSFEPNPGWSNFYAPSQEIQQYLQKVADKYSAGRFIKLGHKVVGCAWDATRSKWKIDIQRIATGETFSDEADVIVAARGGLNDYVWPKIDGLWSFKGKIVHSAAWDTSFDYSNKRIGVIGGGSSAIQIVPKLQKLAGTQLSCFIRSKTWISSTFGASAMQKLGLDHEEFTQEDFDKYMSDPKKYHEFRKMIETEGNAMHPFSLKGSPMSAGARDMFTQLMKGRLAKKPELGDFLIPSFAPGCRRLTPGEGFLEALTEDNVEFINTAIEAVTETGVVLQGGRAIELDVLVCATGFNAAGPPPFPVIGVDGRALSDRWEKYPEAYMSVAVDGFPNYFTMLGPNSGVASGSLTKIIESAGDYILKCIRKLQKEDIQSMQISSRAIRSWVNHVENYFTKTVFLDDCRTWYRRDNRIIGLWPGSTVHAIEVLRSPRWEDFEYEYGQEAAGDRLLRWLGSGWSELQLSGGDISYYIEPEYVDVPSAPFPEKTAKWNMISFSH